MKQMELIHPTAKMLVEISKAQDIEAGDGTTSVVIIAGSLLNQAQILLDKGIHASVIAEGFQFAVDEAIKIIEQLKPNDTMCDQLLKYFKSTWLKSICI